ncbi:MAG: hypothetical protein ACRDQB_15805 [Thermocrispum sp.]
MKWSELHCVDVVELMTEYLEGELDESLRALRAARGAGVPRLPRVPRAAAQHPRRRRALAEPDPQRPPLSPEVRASLLEAFRERGVSGRWNEPVPP